MKLKCKPVIHLKSHSFKMICIPFSNVILSLVYFNIIRLTECVFSQVNTDIMEIELAILDEAKAFHKTRWFNLDKMSDFGKFMLCVDAYQKKIGIHLMDQHYITENGTTALPNFEILYLNIRFTLANSDNKLVQMAMNCPLHEVQFAALNYNAGENFYISDSVDKLCFYTFTSITGNLEQYPDLKVTAKICELLLDIRYNSLELEQGLASKILQSGLDSLKWSSIEGFDNNIRFMICLDIHEKLTRTQLYSYSYTTNNHENVLPVFNMVHMNLSLSNGVEETLVPDFEVLECPLNRIRFPKQKNMNQFYLAKSYQADCVYKVAPVDSRDLQQVTHIQAEICGIFGFFNEDTEYLEHDLVERISISMNPSFDFFSWNHLASITQTERFRMCINVMKKVHLEYFFIEHKSTIRTCRQIPTIDNFKLKLEHQGIVNLPLQVFQCPLHKFSKQFLDKKHFYIADSPRIGCVYTLSTVIPDVFYGARLLKIDNLICGIYPPRYFLKLDRLLIIRPSI